MDRWSEAFFKIYCHAFVDFIAYQHFSPSRKTEQQHLFREKANCVASFLITFIV